MTSSVIRPTDTATCLQNFLKTALFDFLCHLGAAQQPINTTLTYCHFIKLVWWRCKQTTAYISSNQWLSRAALIFLLEPMAEIVKHFFCNVRENIFLIRWPSRDLQISDSTTPKSPPNPVLLLGLLRGPDPPSFLLCFFCTQTRKCITSCLRGKSYQTANI